MKFENNVIEKIFFFPVTMSLVLDMICREMLLESFFFFNNVFLVLKDLFSEKSGVLGS